MNRQPLLRVCARIDGHPHQHRLIHRYCGENADWQALLNQAEQEGMAPLLKKHLDESAAAYPAPAQRSLAILVKRHQNQARVRHQVLLEVLQLLQEAQVDVLVLKGAALSYTLYPDPWLRPMRDIDLLFRAGEAHTAHQLLKRHGFYQAAAVIPTDHFHLPPLYRDAGETKICIEIHRGLYPNCPPWYPVVDFERLFQGGQKFTIGSYQARTLADEEMLHYLYQHGFHAPLTYEPFKLVNAADLTGFVENHFTTLDWPMIDERFPLLPRAVPLLHHIAPWNPEKIDADWLPQRPLEPRAYNGWPHKRLKELRGEGLQLPAILRSTFLPSKWWLGIYYGSLTRLERLFCLLWKHPRQVYWWARLYRSLNR